MYTVAQLIEELQQMPLEAEVTIVHGDSGGPQDRTRVCRSIKTVEELEVVYSEPHGAYRLLEHTDGMGWASATTRVVLSASYLI